MFLAYGDDPSLKTLTKGMSATERKRLDRQVAKVRREGYSVVHPKNSPFVAAAPVFDEAGLRATVAFLGVGDRDLTKPIRRLRATADAISDALGAPPEAATSADS